jgi:hypothetical protein
MSSRSPEEIRASIERNRQELGESLARLRVELTRLTDWRSRLRRHRTTAAGLAAATGFLLGGGPAAVGSLVTGAGGPPPARSPRRLGRRPRRRGRWTRGS